MDNFVNLYPFSGDIVARASVGPHAHWSSFIDCEGARFQWLHEIVSNEAYDADKADTLMGQILGFVKNQGNDAASDYLAYVEDMNEDDVPLDPKASSLEDAAFDSFAKTKYFKFVRKSVRLLQAASASPEATAAIANLNTAALDAFCAGRDARMWQSRGHSEAPSRPAQGR